MFTYFVERVRAFRWLLVRKVRSPLRSERENFTGGGAAKGLRSRSTSSSNTSLLRVGEALPDGRPGDGARMVLTEAPLATLPFRLPATLLPDGILERASEREAVGEGLRGPASETCASFFAGDARGDASGARARFEDGGEIDAERNCGGVSRCCAGASLNGVGE